MTLEFGMQEMGDGHEQPWRLERTSKVPALIFIEARDSEETHSAVLFCYGGGEGCNLSISLIGYMVFLDF